MSPKIDGGRIVSWSGAEASNAIPSQSICELAIAADELPAPVENADRLEITALGNGHAQIFAHGIGGHASMPEGTINAVASSWRICARPRMRLVRATSAC